MALDWVLLCVLGDDCVVDDERNRGCSVIESLVSLLCGGVWLVCSLSMVFKEFLVQ